MYYGLITLSVIIFGFTFFFNSGYEKHSGSGLTATLIFSLISGLGGIVPLFVINNFSLTYTPFTLILASVSAISGLLFNFCSLKAFGKINLSLYSLFSMLGGMALPFVAGILFFDEKLTVGKIVAFVIICVALALTINGEMVRGGGIYYLGIFTLNGMSGVLATIFKRAAFEKGSDADYSIWAVIVTIVLSALLLPLAARKEKPRLDLPAVLYASGNGVLNRVANWILLIALTKVDASVQYPMVTGGVMIVSTAICFFTGKKPSKKEVISVAVAFVGLIALVVI